MSIQMFCRWKWITYKQQVICIFFILYFKVISETLQICTNAELVDVRLDTYRDRLIYLRQLQFNSSEGNQFLNEIALRYLVGNLFINFSIIWDHVIEVISSHAVDGNIAFWDIWREILQDAAQKCGTFSVIFPDVESATNCYVMLFYLF